MSKRGCRLAVWCFLVLSFCMVHSLAAADFPEIKAPALKAKMDAGEKVFLLNPLSDIEFNQGYISGSVNIPLHLLGTTDKLPQDKDTLLVSYCLGPK